MSTDPLQQLVSKFLANNQGPTDDELNSLDLDTFVRASEGTFKRPPHQRVFVNRSLRLDKIQWLGFDMDYTLAMYTPAFEELSYDIIMQRLVQAMGYPSEITSLPYEPNFAVRGLFLDTELGNFMKIDNFGNIVNVVHGKSPISKSEVAKLYPSMIIHSDDINKRYYLLNTLFNIPEACAFANLVHFFESRRNARATSSGSDDVSADAHDVIRTEAMDIYYKNLWHDVREAMDWSHLAYGTNKPIVLANKEKYLIKTPKLAEFLDALRSGNKKTFLLTNSPWNYTTAVMSYLLDDQKDQYKSWLDYFDFVIVDAAKPSFFSTGNTLRELDIATGRLKISRVEHGVAKVYSGGSLSKFEKLAGVSNGNQVLYVGDHIFSDVRVSKKKHGWRTFLVVPELEREISTWLDPQTQKCHSQLVALMKVKAALYREYTAESKNPPDVKALRKAIHRAVEQKDQQFNAFFGSLFGSGLQPSFFAMQVQRYADIYAPHYYSLLNYPLWYTFQSEPALQPHEMYI